MEKPALRALRTHRLVVSFLRCHRLVVFPEVSSPLYDSFMTVLHQFYDQF